MGSAGGENRRSPSAWADGRAPGRVPARWIHARPVPARRVPAGRMPAGRATRVETARVKTTRVPAQAAEEPFREAPREFVARAAGQFDRQDEVVPFLLGLQVLHDLTDL